jgi:hypothetical protein
MKFPVFWTTANVLEYCWRERRLIGRFAAWPLTIAVVLQFLAIGAVGVSAWNTSDLESPALYLPGLANLAQMLIYLPLSVTWLRLVVLGTQEAEQRAIFTFGRTERRFIGWQLLCFVGMVAFITAGVTTTQAIMGDPDLIDANPTPALLAMGWTIIWILGVLLVLTRVTMVFVFAALDQPASFAAAWRMTKGLSWRLLGATLLLALAAVAVQLVFKLVGFILSAIAAIGAGTGISPLMMIISTIGSSITGLMFWLTSATLYGIVYNMLIKHEPQPQAETAVAPS